MYMQFLSLDVLQNVPPDAVNNTEIYRAQFQFVHDNIYLNMKQKFSRKSEKKLALSKI